MPPDQQVAPQAGSEAAQLQQAANSMSPDKWAMVKEMLQKLPPDQREEWFQKFAASTGEMGTDAQDAMTRADSLRVDQPGMVGEQGGYQMAASPLAHIGAGMQNYQANKQYKEGQEALSDARQAGADQRIVAAKANAGMPTAGMQAGMAIPGAGPQAPSMGGPGRGAAPGGMTPEMMQKIAMMRSR